jgi:hypothetical protein
MRLWVHRIWRYTNETPLRTCGPKEDKKFEALVSKEGELIVAYAWNAYVSADPPPYVLDSVTRRGDAELKKYGHEHWEDTSVRTFFPLSAFLYDPSSYLIEAKLFAEGPNREEVMRKSIAFAFEPSKTVPSAWNVTSPK